MINPVVRLVDPDRDSLGNLAGAFVLALAATIAASAGPARLAAATDPAAGIRENDPRLFPSPPRSALPADGRLLAAHPETAAEWWYYTGAPPDGGRIEYGFELTFFRARLSDGDDLNAAHFALTDVAGKAFRYAEKIHRPFPGIAETDPSRLRVSIENWETREENSAHLLRASMAGPGSLCASRHRKPAVVNGEGGISGRGPRPDEYSRYVSIPASR